jgi:hypothetical protein
LSFGERITVKKFAYAVAHQRQVGCVAAKLDCLFVH